jgi:hypothetical protein
LSYSKEKRINWGINKYFTKASNPELFTINHGSQKKKNRNQGSDKILNIDLIFKIIFYCREKKDQLTPKFLSSTHYQRASTGTAQQEGAQLGTTNLKCQVQVRTESHKIQRQEDGFRRRNCKVGGRKGKQRNENRALRLVSG